MRSLCVKHFIGFFSEPMRSFGNTLPWTNRQRLQNLFFFSFHQKVTLENSLATKKPGFYKRRKHKRKHKRLVYVTVKHFCISALISASISTRINFPLFVLAFMLAPGPFSHDKGSDAWVASESLLRSYKAFDKTWRMWRFCLFFRGKAVKDLLQSILSTPTISRRSEPKISPAAQLLLMGASDDVSKREDEVKRIRIDPLSLVFSRRHFCHCEYRPDASAQAHEAFLSEPFKKRADASHPTKLFHYVRHRNFPTRSKATLNNQLYSNIIAIIFFL